MNIRVNSRILIETKEKSTKKLVSRYLGIPNKQILASLDEVVDDLQDHHLDAANSFEELEFLLDN